MGYGTAGNWVMGGPIPWHEAARLNDDRERARVERHNDHLKRRAMWAALKRNPQEPRKIRDEGM